MKHLLYLLIVTTLHNGHAISPLYNITQTWHITNEGIHMNTYIYHIYRETKKGNHIYDKNTLTEKKCINVKHYRLCLHIYIVLCMTSQKAVPYLYPVLIPSCSSCHIDDIHNFFHCTLLNITEGSSISISSTHAFLFFMPYR